LSHLPEIRAGDAFPTTCWSSLAVQGQDTGSAQAAFEKLALRYWRPIAAAIRSRSATTDEDAVDLTQEFFLWMLAGDFLARVDRNRGSFRGFIKRSLFNFLHDAHRREHAQRRAGGHNVLSIDADPAVRLPQSETRSPEELLDDTWRREVLSQAARNLESELRSKGKDRTYEIFQHYFLDDGALDYAGLARQHGISTSDVSNSLSHAKKRYRSHLRSVVLDTVSSETALETELAWLFEGRDT